MGKINIHTIKAYLAITAFVLFWMFTFAFVFPNKIFRKKLPKLAWNYDQVFGQKWNFFTQPHIYNDRLVFVLRNTATMQVTDSIDVLDALWKNKQHHVPFNTKEDVLDHIMLRQTAHLREAIENAKNVAKASNNYTLNNNPASIVNSMVEADKGNAATLYNMESFGKMMLQEKGIKIDGNTQYKILFYTDYIRELKNKSNVKTCTLDFESSYKNFK